MVAVGALLLLSLAQTPLGQEIPAISANSTVPAAVNFSGTVLDSAGKPRTGLLGITFSLYSESQGGAPLWMETLNVTADRSGRYSVVLGSTKSTGLPADLFASGQARWLGECGPKDRRNYPAYCC